MKRILLVAVAGLLLAGAVLAQRGGRGGMGGGGFGGGGRNYGGGGFGRGRSYGYDSAQNAREIPQHQSSGPTPTWTNTPGFEKDVFTFVRIKRDSQGPSGGPWWTDTPDSDLNLSFRLNQMTSVKVDPDGRFLQLTEKELADHPFIYMVEPGSLYLSDAEVVALRKYLLNGGFLWLDDFWGEQEWAGMAGELRKVFPNRDFVELPLDHPIYHCVFELTAKTQIPGIDYWRRSGGSTSERYDSTVVHHRAIFDDKGRLMVMATHNTDNGDGWERETEDAEYFKKFSEKVAYPLGINILFYQMTH